MQNVDDVRRADTLKEPAARPATIYDVARRAQVSHETVARVLRGNPSVKKGNRERVEAALAELDYRPNAAARSLATRRPKRLGALVYNLRETGPSQFIDGATSAAREAGYLLDIVSIGSGSTTELAAAVDLINQSDLAGVIAFAPTDVSRSAIESADFRVPVFFESEPEQLGDETSLNTVGINLIVEHLAGLGHVRIAHVAGPSGWMSARHRRRAYGIAMERHGLAPMDVIEAADWSAASGHRIADQLLDGERPTAVVAANDQVAFGLLSALHDRGLRVPADMSVVGFDDIPESAFSIPPLTTVHIDLVEIGRRAVENLLSLTGDDAAVVDPTPPGSAHLVVRRSTAEPAPTT